MKYDEKKNKDAGKVQNISQLPPQIDVICPLSMNCARPAFCFGKACMLWAEIIPETGKFSCAYKMHLLTPLIVWNVEKKEILAEQKQIEAMEKQFAKKEKGTRREVV